VAENNRPIVKQSLAVKGSKTLFFFVRTDFAGRVKARPADRDLAGDGQRRAFTPAVILFIALPDARDNIEPG
jgi:hypothetical protein